MESFFFPDFLPHFLKHKYWNSITCLRTGMYTYNCSLWSETFCTALQYLYEMVLWKLKISSGSAVWKLSARAFTLVKSLQYLYSAACETDSQHLAGQDIEWERVRRSRESNKAMTNEAMQSKWESVRLSEWEYQDERESGKKNEGVQEMMTIHHCRYSHCITGWHEWLPRVSEYCRPVPGIPSACSTHEWWLLPGCSGLLGASEMAMDKSDLLWGLHRQSISLSEAEASWQKLWPWEIDMCFLMSNANECIQQWRWF